MVINVADLSFLFAVMVRRRAFSSRGSFDRVFSRCGCSLRHSTKSRQLHQELHTEWRMRRADELSIVHQNQEV